MKKKSILPVSTSGQSLVELAISLVILLYLLSGAAEFGLLFFQYIQMRDAAQEGALYGSINPNDAGPIIERVRGASDKPLDLSTAGPVTVAVTATDKTTSATKALNVACEGDGLVVTLTYKHHIFMPFMPKLLGQTDLDLKAEVIDTILTTNTASPPCPTP